MAFLRSAWYVAAWADEISEKLFSRRLLGEPVLLYRKQDGSIVALADRCPHRFVSLHLGQRVEDDVRCAYHGLRFNSSGICVDNPTSGPIPSNARVRSYPIVERHGLVFIWMGDAEKADDSKIPDFSFLTDSNHAVVKGYLQGNAHYQLVVDNILDLSHSNFLHRGTLDCEAIARVTPKVIETEDYVEVQRWMPDALQPRLVTEARGFPNKKLDAWNDVRWFVPGNMILTSGLCEVGAPREDAKISQNLHLVTPDTETSHHYFWASIRDYNVHDSAVDEKIRVGFTKAFATEDKPILENQQQQMNGRDFWELRPALLLSDGASVRVRRRMAKLIREETGAPDLQDAKAESA